MRGNGAAKRIGTGIRLTKEQYFELKVYAIRRGKDVADVLGEMALQRLERARRAEQRQNEQRASE